MWKDKKHDIMNFKIKYYRTSYKYEIFCKVPILTKVKLYDCLSCEFFSSTKEFYEPAKDFQTLFNGFIYIWHVCDF